MKHRAVRRACVADPTGLVPELRPGHPGYRLAVVAAGDLIHTDAARGPRGCPERVLAVRRAQAWVGREFSVVSPACSVIDRGRDARGCTNSVALRPCA